MSMEDSAAVPRLKFETVYPGVTDPPQSVTTSLKLMVITQYSHSMLFWYTVSHGCSASVLFVVLMPGKDGQSPWWPSGTTF